MRRLVPLFVAALMALTVGVASAKDHMAKDAMAKDHMTKDHMAKGHMADEPALGGYCPVAYIAAGRAIKGDPKYSTTVMGHKFLFVNADAKKAFDADQSKFLVAYDGWCATAVAEGAKVKSDPTIFTVHNNRTYLFSNADAKKIFDADAEGTVKKAEANWPTLAASK